MYIQFTKDYEVKAEDGPAFLAGDVVEVSRVSGQHFINRGVAVEAEAPKKAARGKSKAKNSDENGSASQQDPVSANPTSESSDATVDVPAAES